MTPLVIYGLGGVHTCIHLCIESDFKKPGALACGRPAACLKMASTCGGIVVHISSASATIESVSITEKIVEKSKMESIFIGSEHQSP